MVKDIAVTTGRRKTSVARVFLREGKGIVTLNGIEFEKYFPMLSHRIFIQEPLNVTDNLGKYDILITVKGGGVASQAGAVRHGIARALLMADNSNISSLKANGFLTRDPRMVERKKYGRKGARRRFQFSKR